MSQTFRRPEILDIVRRDGRVTVEDLAARFGVTLQTIRKDLADLAEAGRLERVHGGAILPESGVVQIAYERRRSLHAEAKAAIAALAADRIPDGASLFLGIGTTTEAVAAALAGHSDLLVVTNNLNVAAILRPHPAVRTVLTGGTLRPADGGLTGPLAAATLAEFRPDIAVVGCSALDPAGEILDYDADEIAVTRAALARARTAWLVADASKFARHAPLRAARLADVALLLTDAPLPAALARRCAETGPDVAHPADPA